MLWKLLRHARPLGFAGALIAAGWLSNSALAASIIYVDDDALPAGNGASWRTALNDLQTALAIATAGDEIRIAQGTYKPAPPNGSRDATFTLVNGVAMRGGYAGIGAADPDANDRAKFETILSGDLNGDDGPNSANRSDNSYGVVTGATSVSRETVLDGLTIRAGWGDYFDPDLPAGSVPDDRGGGIRLVSGASPLIIRCAIRENYADGGGGIWGGSPRIEKCFFQGNFVAGVPASLAGGGAIAAGAVVIDCEFRQNGGGHSGGAIIGATVVQRCRFFQNGAENGGACFGVGLLIDCLFEGNAALYGGALDNCGTAINCLIRRNNADSGGAIYNISKLVNCVLIGNHTYTTGAIRAPSAQIVNCIVVGNTKTVTNQNGAGVAIASVIRNSIVWDNGAKGSQSESTQVIGVPPSATQNSCIQGWTGSLGGTGNHGNDPRFIDADGPDNVYGTEDDNPRLLANSPLINNGNDAALPADTFDLDEDGDTSEMIPVDLDWLPRIVGGTVDVGAFEFQGNPCPADITGTGEVNVNDLLAVINAWGSCVSGQPCNADLNLDGSISVSDLLAVIDNWGACR